MRLIDADALKKVMIETLEALLKNPKMDNQEAHLLAAFHTVGNMIEDAKTVDAVSMERCKDCIYYRRVYAGARKKGRWREYPTADGMNQCSECGILHFGESNFCSNCGSDMRE